jgi:alpha-mannosidase
MMGSVGEIYREAEIFNQKPYAVNVFPTGKESREYKNVSLDGNVVLTNLHHNGKGEYVARIYNPSSEKESFTLKFGEVEVSGFANKGEVVSVVLNGDKCGVVHDKTPV